MWCGKCKNHLAQCACDDLEERLDDAARGGSFAYRKCKKCGKHYERCKCKDPEWKIEGAGK